MSGKTGSRKSLQFDHELLEREGVMKDIARHALDNFHNRTQTDQRNHTFVIVAGGSGIGKTRVGFEAGRAGVLVSHLAPGADERLVASLQNPCYIYINFNNGERFDPSVDFRPEDQRLGIRLATAGLLATGFHSLSTPAPIWVY